MLDLRRCLRRMLDLALVDVRAACGSRRLVFLGSLMLGVRWYLFGSTAMGPRELVLVVVMMTDHLRSGSICYGQVWNTRELPL